MPSNKSHNKTGIFHFFFALKNSLSGLKFAFKDEEAFRLEVYATCILAPCIYLIELSLEYKLYIISSIALLWLVELLNSAVEAVVDLVTLEFHQLAKKAKDIASAAVLISLLHVGMVLAVGIYKAYLQ